MLPSTFAQFVICSLAVWGCNKIMQSCKNHVNIPCAAIPIVKSAAAHLFFCYILKYAFKEDSSGEKVSKSTGGSSGNTRVY